MSEIKPERKVKVPVKFTITGLTVPIEGTKISNYGLTKCTITSTIVDSNVVLDITIEDHVVYHTNVLKRIVEDERSKV